MTALSGWGNFYAIVGSSAGALIGLQFVVMTLIANIPINRGDAQAGDTFTTPTVVHFGVVLFLSAVASVPWDGIVVVVVLWGLMGLGGVVYVIHVARRLRRKPPTSPCSRTGCFMSCSHSRPTRCLQDRQGRLLSAAADPVRRGAAALLLLFVGIHNAWDLVTYHVFVKKQEPTEAEQRQ